MLKGHATVSFQFAGPIFSAAKSMLKLRIGIHKPRRSCGCLRTQLETVPGLEALLIKYQERSVAQYKSFAYYKQHLKQHIQVVVSQLVAF